jgi:magnesium and cobalt transporter
MLRDMQHSRSHLAVVVDEYGAVSGVVSIEDCIEAILGEIQDEHDDDSDLVRGDGPGRYIAAGAASVMLVNQTLGSEFTEGENTTIGGLVFSAIGRSATVGDTVLLNGWTITVLSMRRRRILSVSLETVNEEVSTGS